MVPDNNHEGLIGDAGFVEHGHDIAEPVVDEAGCVEVVVHRAVVDTSSFAGVNFCFKVFGDGPGVMGCAGDVGEEDACFVACGFGEEVLYVGFEFGFGVSEILLVLLFVEGGWVVPEVVDLWSLGLVLGRGSCG